MFEKKLTLYQPAVLESPFLLFASRGDQYATILRTIVSMIPRGNGSSKRIAAPRTTISDPESALDHVEELLYVSKDRDTTSDLKRPRAASGSALLTDEVEASPKTHSSTYVYGKPCPEENEDCHYHNQLTQHCHIPWRHCSSARMFVFISF